MARVSDISIGQELLNVPMGDMIKQMAFAIADAQFELDESSIRVAELMSGSMVERDDEGNLVYRLGGGTGAIDTADPPASGSAPGKIDTRVQFGTITTTTVTGTGTNAVTKVETTPNLLSMFELGFAPTFYQFVDTIIEVKIAIKITRERTFELKAGVSVDYTSNRGKKKKNSSVTVAAHVDATYSSKFSYSAEGSSLLRTKLAPVPPPAVFEERVRALFALPA